MNECDECGGSLAGGVIMLTIMNETDREVAVMCSPDCFLDRTAKLFAHMNKKGMER